LPLPAGAHTTITSPGPTADRTVAGAV
jgi:hypothetical protein